MDTDPSQSGEALTYAQTGVDYGAMDPFKIAAQQAARKTSRNIEWLRLYETPESRGASAYLIEGSDHYLAHVEEGLGTKNLVAQAMYELTGKLYYGQSAQCCVGMIINDVIVSGASPLSVAMHLAVGESSWFDDQPRWHDLIDGWAHACMLAECVWSGGETPTLKDIIMPGTIVLAGSAIGLIKPKRHLITPSNIRAGDSIIIIESSGVHANGLTLMRRIADQLPHGYLTLMPDGRTYGETLLDPTHIYARATKACLAANIRIHGAENITGHGWRKLMRPVQPFTYVIDQLPTQQPIFDFICEHGPVSDVEAYGNLNMGAGFVLYVPEGDVSSALSVLRNLGFRPVHAGYIEAGPRRVVIRPKNIEFLGNSLAIR